MKKAVKKTGPKNEETKQSKPPLKSIHRKLSKKSGDETDQFGDGAIEPLGSPVSLGRKMSEMTWEKARSLASRENHLWW